MHGHGRALVHEWLSVLEELSLPERRIFTHIKIWGEPAHLKLPALCLACNASQLAYFEEQIYALVQRVAGSNAGCKTWQRSWTDQLLYEAGV